MKSFVVKVVPKQGEGQEESIPFHAPEGRCWTEQSVEEALDKVIDYLDRKYPAWEFRLVALKGGRQFNFVYDGDRSSEGIAAALGKREGGQDDASGTS
jgi:hypothetical protein